jgi:hypothetical protein
LVAPASRRRRNIPLTNSFRRNILEECHENANLKIQDLNTPGGTGVPTPPPLATPNQQNRQEKIKEDCRPEEAQAFAKRRPANEGSMHSNPSQPSEPNRENTTGEKTTGENTPPLTTHDAERRAEIDKLEASIEGAMRGNWRDLRTVFNAVGLTPRKPATSSNAARKRVKGR